MIIKCFHSSCFQWDNNPITFFQFLYRKIDEAWNDKRIVFITSALLYKNASIRINKSDNKKKIEQENNEETNRKLLLQSENSERLTLRNKMESLLNNRK